MTCNWWLVVLYLTFCITSFPFLHDGIYYHTRHVMNPLVYKEGWKDHVDGRAVLDFTYTMRCILAFIAIGCTVLMIVFV